MNAQPIANNMTKPPALEELLRAWGLRTAPFTADEKSPAIYPAESHREALNLLESTAALRGVMLLTGAPGSGKSTLLKTWMRGLEPKRHLPLLITQSSLSASGVLEILLAKLGERPRFKRSASLLLLEKHLADIDPLTLVLILAGDEYLLGSLRLSVQRALFTRISATAVLAPLARHDIAPYLNWQVSRAGLERDILEAAAIDLLAEASQGNPRTLNLLAQAAWLGAARSGATTIHPDHIHRALGQVPASIAKATGA